MLRTNTVLWRVAFLSGLGIVPASCGADVEDSGGPGGIGRAALGGATPCLDSVPYLEQGLDTGLERCSDGRAHRPATFACAANVTLPRPGNREPFAGGGGDAICSSDSDCTQRPLGHCEVPSFHGGPVLGFECQYGCQQDADCAPGSLCQCGDPVGTCVKANCLSDADCGSGLLCTQGTRKRWAGCGISYEFFCEKPEDRCRVDEDCPPTTYGSYCEATDGARVCSAFDGSVCGRPFLVEGSPRLAHLERSSDWLAAGARPDGSRLSAPQRAELARAWAQLGLMEHASVAAFARFTLQLLSVAAPATLIEQSQQALADELLHARLCFTLASTYASEALGPGPLPTAHALDLTSLEDVAALTLHEGCVGETLAAIEASEALALAHDPAVRAALARIQQDERRHAELGWRFVTWAIRTGGASVQRRIQRELAELLAHAPEAATADAGDASVLDISTHGILSARHRAELRTAALRDVVLPCALALLPAAEGESCLATNCAA